MHGENTFRLETLNPTSDAVIPTLLKNVTIEDNSSASAYKKIRSKINERT